MSGNIICKYVNWQNSACLATIPNLTGRQFSLLPKVFTRQLVFEIEVCLKLIKIFYWYRLIQVEKALNSILGQPPVMMPQNSFSPDRYGKVGDKCAGHWSYSSNRSIFSSSSPSLISFCFNTCVETYLNFRHVLLGSRRQIPSLWLFVILVCYLKRGQCILGVGTEQDWWKAEHYHERLNSEAWSTYLSISFNFWTMATMTINQRVKKSSSL